MEANRVAGGGATIRVPAGLYPITIDRVASGLEDSGDFDLNAPMTIEGAGPSMTLIDGALRDRVFHVAAHPVTLRDLTVQGGNPGGGESGGGIAADVSSDLTVENVVVAFNTGPLGGGGIASDGALSMRRCVVHDNVSSNTGGGLSHGGFDVNAWIEDSLFQRNTALAGGGIGGANLVIERTTMQVNVAAGGRGGAGFANGSMLMINDTLYGNSSTGNASVWPSTSSHRAAELLDRHPELRGQRLIEAARSDARGYFAVTLRDGFGSLLLRDSIVAGNVSGYDLNGAQALIAHRVRDRGDPVERLQPVRERLDLPADGARRTTSWRRPAFATDYSTTGGFAPDRAPSRRSRRRLQSRARRRPGREAAPTRLARRSRATGAATRASATATSARTRRARASCPRSRSRRSSSRTEGRAATSSARRRPTAR